MSDSVTWVTIISHLSRGQIHKVPQKFCLEADEVTLLSSTSFNDLVKNATELLRRNGWRVSQHFKHSTRSHQFCCAHQNPEEHAAAALRAAGHHPKSPPPINWGAHRESRRNLELSSEEKRRMVMAATGFTEDPEFTHSTGTTAAASVTEHFLSRHLKQIMAAAGLPSGHVPPPIASSTIQEWAQETLGTPFAPHRPPSWNQLAEQHLAQPQPPVFVGFDPLGTSPPPRPETNSALQSIANGAALIGRSVIEATEAFSRLNKSISPTPAVPPPPPPAKPALVHIRPGTRKIHRATP